MALSDDAKKELREAIAIVREDRLEGYLRKRFAPGKKDELLSEGEEGEEGEKETVEKEKVGDPKPPVKKVVEPVEPPPVPRRSGYWGELMDD